MPGNIVLIGFMGAGKSTVGRALATRLRYRYIDTDELIVERSGMTVADIWAAEGEKGFRDREHEAVLHACAGAGRVVACGGGAVLELRNYGILKGSGTVVYLRAPAEVLRAHVGDGTGRPLLAEPGAFERLLAARTPAYEAAADVIVDVAGCSPDEVAATVVERLP